MQLTKTITTIFIVPTLMIDRSKLKDNGFINGYAKDGQKDVQYQNAAYLLFRPKNIDKFKLFLDEEYERTKSIVDDYDYEGGFVVLVYQLNPKFDKDFKLIKEGLYSKTSKTFQELFPKILKVERDGMQVDQKSLQYRIFNKTDDLKLFWEENIGVEFTEDMEFWQGWIEEKEILKLENLKEYV